MATWIVKSLSYSRRKALFFGAFSGAYCYALHKSRFANSEWIRIGFSGSITSLCCEMLFYMIDTVNMRSKT